MEIAKTKKEKKVATPKVEMVSYSIKMVIPTGAYANIQPEIIVKAGTPETALDYIAPHMNKLWKEYFMVNERKQPVGAVSQSPVADATYVGPAVVTTATASPVASVAFQKATQAVNSCLSSEALGLIIKQITGSVKLNEADKVSLAKLAAEKQIELHEKNL